MGNRETIEVPDHKLKTLVAHKDDTARKILYAEFICPKIVTIGSKLYYFILRYSEEIFLECRNF